MLSYMIIISFLSLYCLEGQKTETSRLVFFDIDLLKYAAEDRKGNVVVSPASIKSVLAMILEGASGATASEIRSALRLSSDKDEFREQLNLYLAALQGNNACGAILHNYNTVFVSDKLKLNKEYEVMLRNVYMTEVCKTNFRDPLQAVNTINRWINITTRGLIPSIIEPLHITPTTELLMTNALYFKSTWQHSFDPRSTRSACFYHHDVCRSVAMMELHAELNYAYVDNLRAHALELPYQGRDYSMILLVPQEKEGLLSLVRDLPYMSLPQISTLFEPTDITLSMPKFTIEYSEDMIAPLKSMRIYSLFSNQANLSRIFDEGSSAQINSMVQKVYIAIDETGTEAAATSVSMVIPLIQNGVQLRVDRPFAFFIRDNRRGLVIFEGKIEEPSQYVDKNTLRGQSIRKNGGNSIKRSYG